SEIYGGLANAWDYGPLGVELKNNIKQAWWKKFVQQSPHNVGLDSGILLNTAVWEASGHLANFDDPLMDCKSCRTRHRADTLIEDYATANALDVTPAGWSNEELQEYISTNSLKCPDCGESNFTDIRQFNMMFKTFQGVTEDSATTLYLRPETAQGIFINFKNIQRSSRKKIPFGVCQVGKSFRNEITPGNFIFRTREFEQMEMEFFCKPGTDMDWFDFWRGFCRDWLLSLGINEENLRLRDHGADELSFYSLATTDFEYLFPFGWGELWGIANRTDYDLGKHTAASGDEMVYFDPETNEKYTPYVIEPALGVERMLLALLTEAYDEEEIAEGDVRTVLRFHPAIAPIKAAVLPLSKKLAEPATAVFAEIAKHFAVDYDDSGSIGKRYRRYDEIGTPWCITYDFESQEDGCVTLRDRDTMEQVRLPIGELVEYIRERLTF
ncbi:MAG: glycine--tRNA ligase, partial [Oscillospiraceae bacterium]|nr:glycine--tRNA ligase [Oscillospiraceae bacterium]